MKFKFILIIIISTVFQLKAQIYPPEILCLDDETIHWNLPNNTCGSFVQYQIYSSKTLNGTFQLLANITNQNQTTYLDSNPNDETRYYFMKSDYSCPGEVAIHSDTISNSLLKTPLLEYVSVENNQVYIKWQKSLSTETKSYIIYKVQASGTYPIDTVTSTEYLDINSNGGDRAEIYFVVALDACDNTSIFGKPHFTVFLEDSLDICTNDIHIKWNPYKNSIHGIEDQQVWIMENNEWKLWETLPPTDSTFVIQGLPKDQSFDVLIKSIEKNTKYIINSNIINVSTNPLDEITITNVSVAPDNLKTTIEWIWNSKVSLKNVQLLKKGNVISDVIGTPDIVNSIDDNSVYSAKVNYQLRLDNGCPENSLSNIGTSIFLSGEYVNANTNTLSWTNFDFEDASFDHFEIYRTTDSSPIAIQTENSFTDIDATALGSTSYYIIAQGKIRTFDGNEYTIRSRSNTITIYKKSDVFLPNAFAPLGNNRFFKPVVLSSENISQYAMYVYDRWGKQVFFSDDIDVGWDGFNNGQLMSPGVYSYIVQFSQNNGQTEIRKGVVMLVD